MKAQLIRDLTALADEFYKKLQYDPSCEFGSIGLDCKRPFGNSYVEGDILWIIGAEKGEDGWTDEQEQYARQLYCEELVPFLRKRWKVSRAG